MVRILLLTLFISLNAYSDQLLFECENGFSYKINKNSTSFYRNINGIWKKIDKVKFLENKYELFIPNSNYLSCSNKDLPICNFSKMITYNPKKKEVNVREIIQNDCYIGTMGCNKYSKGLELNQKRCRAPKVKK